MTIFKTKMHQIQLSLGPRPRPCWGSLHHPQTLWLNLRGLLLRRGRGKDKAEGGQGSSTFICGFTPMRTPTLNALRLREEQ